MRIVCPHCTTSYGINPATLGEAGRTVRCSRCKEVWLARPEDAVQSAPVPAMATAAQSAGSDAAAEWEAMARAEHGDETPVIDSPSISAEMPAGNGTEWPSVASQDNDAQATSGKKRRFRMPRLLPKLPRMSSLARLPSPGLSTACPAMGALILALVIWRADVVRLLPQTALFYKTIGLEVNTRGLAFKDIKVTNETIDGKPVLIIEGVIVGQNRRPVELPRLRFAVRDAHGAEIYAWNAVLEQTVLNPGERAVFKSRLASPPPEGRNVDIRFFNRNDLAGGRA